MGSLQELSIRLSTLAVFRELQEDAVINSLRKYLAEPSPALYASFVSALYRANGGILGAYVREICENSENVYVQAVGKKEEIPTYLREAVLEELKTLQMTAELTPETLRSAMEYRGFLPGFVSEAPDIKACYTERTENIGKYGYGIYAKNRMFYLGENAEMPAQTRPAGRERKDGARVDKDIDEPFLHRLLVNFLRAGYNDGAHALFHVPPFQNGRRHAEIGNAPVRARADDYLVYGHVAHFVYRAGIVGQVRESDRFLHFGKVYFVHRVVHRVLVRPIRREFPV